MSMIRSRTIFMYVLLLFLCIAIVHAHALFSYVDILLGLLQDDSRRESRSARSRYYV